MSCEPISSYNEDKYIDNPNGNFPVQLQNFKANIDIFCVPKMFPGEGLIIYNSQLEDFHRMIYVYLDQ